MANDLRIPGMATGMDTQETINKIMKYSRMPLDRLKQKQQKIMWKQEAYRTQNTALSQLKDLIFNLKMQASYNTKTVTSTNSQAVTATATTGSSNASYSMNVQDLATYASNGSAAPTVLRSRLIGSSQAAVTVDGTHNSLKMTFDGIQKTIDLSAYNGVYTAGVDLNNLGANIQTELDTQFGVGKVLVKLTSNNQFEFYTNDGVSHNITVNDGAANSILSSLGYSNGAVADKTALPLKSSLYNMKDQFVNSGFFGGKLVGDSFQISLNGQTLNFTYGNTLEQIMGAINSNTAVGVKASYDDFNDKLVLTATQSGDYNHGNDEIVIGDPDNVLNQLFRISQANETGGRNATFTLNGTAMERESNTFTLDNITYTLSGLTPAGSPAVVKVATDTSGLVTKISDFVKKYNEVIASFNTKLTENRASSGKYEYYEPLTEEQKKELGEDEIKGWEEKAKQGLLHNDSILRSTVNEMRLSITRMVDTPRALTGISLSAAGVDLTANNKFTLAMGAEVKQITLSAASYTSAQFDLLKNDLQVKVDQAFGQGRLQVSLATDKLVFTSQNTGITVTSGSSNDALTAIGFSSGANVKATYNQLTQIGITTGSYTENGKLYLDTDKLTAALEADTAGVMRLLTNSETVTPKTTNPSDVANAKLLEKARKGIFYNLYDTVNANINDIRNQAGSTGTTGYNSILGKELVDISDNMDRVQDRITAEENRLWNVFNSMEQMIAKMNSQSSFLMSLSNGGSNY